MVALPSFFSWPFSLPQLPSISLPANIQRRFLSYVLKRALGRFIKAGGLDVERIQAQISQGWVEIEGLEVDTDAINALIPSGILRLDSGRLDKINARVPFPNLWSDPLSLSLDQITLDFTLDTAPAKGKAPQRPNQYSEPHTLDLAASVTTAADEFLHEELDAYEEAELDRSIRQSLILSQNDPFANDDVPGSFPFSASSGDGSASSPLSPTVESKTALAGLVERILARLQVKIRNVKVRVHCNDSAHGGTFELRIGDITYADESGPVVEGKHETVRVVRLSGVSIYSMPLSPVERPSRCADRPVISTTRSSSTSSASSSSMDMDDNAEMAMSLAVADLRQSTMAASLVSGASIYRSAISEREEDDDDDDAGSDQFSSAIDLSAASNPLIRSVPTIPAITVPLPVADVEQPRHDTPDRVEKQETLLMSFGSEEIVLRLTTESSDILPAHVSPASRTSTSVPSLNISVSVGTLSAIVSPDQTARLLAAFRSLSTDVSSSTPTAPPTPIPTTGQPRICANLRIKAVYIAAIYDMKADVTPDYTRHTTQYWSRPATTYLPFGHLKLRIENIDATYIFRGVPPPRTIRAVASRPGQPRRQSSGVGFVFPASISMIISDVSLFEYLATDSAASNDDTPDPIPGGAYPVLIFDVNLLKQYDVAAMPATTLGPGLGAGAGVGGHAATEKPVSVPVFPEYDGVDWRNSGLQRKSGAGEKAWKVRPRQRGALKSVAAQDDGPAIKITTDLSEGSTKVSTLPIHLFLDLSLLERLLPILRHISPIVKSGRPISGRESPNIPSIPTRVGRFQPTFERAPSYVIDDLDAQAASVSTVKAPTSSSAVFTCPLIRLDIRCPAPPARRGTWGDGAHLRSGIVTLDLHNLQMTLGEIRVVQGRRAEEEVGNVIWDKMILFFSRAPSKKSKAILIVGPLAPDPSDLINSEPLPPVVEIKKVHNPSTVLKASMVTCRIPSVQAKIEQSTIEGIQFFADDITHWLDGAFGDGSAPKPRDDLKMIGSRFFGSRGSSTSSSEEEMDDPMAATVLRVLVTEVDVALHVPRRDAEVGKERILALHASDLETKVESNTAGKQETLLTLTLMDASFTDRTLASNPTDIFRRTIPLSLTSHTSPLFSLKFSSLSDPATQTKETGISLALSTALVLITKDLGWIAELKTFAKTPEGVFEDVVPSEITRISVQVYDCSIHVSSPSLAGALIVVLGDLDVRTDVISDADESGVEVGAGMIRVLAVDDERAVGVLGVGYGDTAEAWRKSGYAPLVELSNLDVRTLRDLTGTREVSVDVISSRLCVTGCADSIATFGQLLGDLSNLVSSEPAVEESPARSPTTLEQSVDVFGSVDEEAFKRVPDLSAGLDLIEDDLPSNLDYLDSATGRQRPTEGDVEGIRAWQTEHDVHSDSAAAKLASEINGETIKVLVDGPVVFEDGYWDSLPILSNGDTDEIRPGKIRVRVHDSAVRILLHDGYDWQRTRKAIEDEMKAVRRRLERIRQLLASGQKADESIEQTSSVLFNSIYIGVDQRNDMDAAALIQAIDDELEGLGGDETASQSSWQTMPGAERAPNRPRTRLRGKRLNRSKKPQIEISISGIKAEVDVYDSNDSMAKRIHVMAGGMEILDHIKTSTWKKFLTEMKADARGNIRETDADMVRVEMMGVRPNLPDLGEELRLRMKILPLKLHVDQDALDFLKAFGGFQLPPDLQIPPGRQEKGANANLKTKEPFFQHVEIFPIELKLDYKPKRVDFAALREGKTIELMNFFHFDGAEMTLRHITLSGVSGVTRLSTLLQDIWTPDVKANQLADVVSGVSPIRSMVNVGSGVADLILLPIEQYRKDGRVARGMQRGTNSFVKSTAMEMMKLGARLATGTQVILERAEGVLGGRFGQEVVGEVDSRGVRRGMRASRGQGEGESSDEEGDVEVVDLVSRYADQPVDMREGVQAAYQSLSRNVTEAAQTILAVPMEVYERSGDSGPLRAVVRAVPIAVLRPMIGASEAVSKTLLGARNSLDPRGRDELGDKYKKGSRG